MEGRTKYHMKPRPSLYGTEVCVSSMICLSASSECLAAVLCLVDDGSAPSLAETCTCGTALCVFEEYCTTATSTCERLREDAQIPAVAPLQHQLYAFDLGAWLRVISPAFSAWSLVLTQGP